MVSLYYVCWLIAVQVRPGAGGAADAVVDKIPNGGGGGGPFDSSFLWMMLAVTMLVFLFALPRQQQKDQAQTAKLLDALKKNDEVLTAGGIVGTIVNMRDGGEFLTLRIDDNTNTKMKVLRKSVIRVLSGEEKKSE